ncbi:hypothetical protein, partial [Duncaniella muris]|uniref:hypothetical protein n=1 Tax=Duncaniella muris TaxID=2094150 RepID=UPI0025A66A07
MKFWVLKCDYWLKRYVNMSEDVSHISSGCMVRGLLYNMLCGVEISKQENYGSETHVWPVFG